VQIATTLQSGQREGTITLERCLTSMVLSGEIKADDAKASANDPGTLAEYLVKKSWLSISSFIMS